MSELYAAIHERMVEQELASGDERPTAREVTSALTRLAIPNQGRALDAGCGGTLSLSLACAEHGFSKVEAVDLNEQSLLKARRIQQRSGRSEVHLARASVAALPFPDGAFTFAICSGVAHHTPEPERVVTELGRVLQKGGTLYLSLYCFSDSISEWLVRALRQAGAIVPFKWLHRLAGGNRTSNNFVLDHMYVPVLWIYRAPEVRAMLARHGFTIAEEWASQMDPFARSGALGRIVTGDGLMRVWVCRKA